MVRRRVALSAALIVALFGNVCASAETLTPRAALARLFISQHIDSDWFVQSFLRQVPASQIETIVDQLKTQLGAFQSVQPQGSKYRVVFANGEDTASIVLDASGRITGLFFEVPQAHATSLEAALDAFRALPGRVSLEVLENGGERAALQPNVALAVGSTFKLAVVDALKQQIDEGKTSWQSVVKLQSQRNSLPSGILQTWPDKAPLTVYAVAALMISQSDNTAADMLIRYLGRQKIEAFAPRDRPFFTTREAFALKDPRNASLLTRYRVSNEAQRRTILAEAGNRPLPDESIFSGQPLATDIEWFFTPGELCKLMRDVESLPFMSINPGVADPGDWKRVAYKGGSETGVLNLTTWLDAKNGKSYCVSATWNDGQPLDTEKFFSLYKSLLATLEM